jgi:OOP family OmpA-OmpF porin
MVTMDGLRVTRFLAWQAQPNRCAAYGRTRIAGIFAIGLALSWASPAAAQTVPSIDARTFRPSTDPRAGLLLEPTTTPGPGLWNVGAFVHYAHDPVALPDPNGQVVGHPVAHALGADLVVGVGLGERASVGLDVPFFLWQDGTPSSGFAASVVQNGAVATSGIGDVALGAKATIVSNDKKGVNIGPGLAALSHVTLPTGNQASFAGEGAVTASAELLGEYAAGAGAVRASLGYILRTERRTWPSAANGVTFGDSVSWAASVVLWPKSFFPSIDPANRQTWELGVHGAVPAGPVAPFGLGKPGASLLSPALLTLDDRLGLGHYRDAYVIIGAEVGLDDAVGVPIVRAIVGLGWAPKNHDRDGDGVLDDADQCPDLPEDRDGIQDEDGCPEDDADGDGVLDEQDACPLVAGVESTDPKKNGCPGPAGPAPTNVAPASGGHE